MASSGVIHEGYLTKMKSGLKRSQKRFFVLSRDKLAYFENNKKVEEIGWMPMASLSRFDLSDSIIRFTSTRSHMSGEKEKHNHEYKLKADTKDEAKVWFDALNDAKKVRGVVLPGMELDEVLIPVQSESAAAVETGHGAKASTAKPAAVGEPGGNSTVVEVASESAKSSADGAEKKSEEKAAGKKEETTEEPEKASSESQDEKVVIGETKLEATEAPKPVSQHFHRGRRITTIEDMRESSRKIFKTYARGANRDILEADQLRRCCADHGYWMSDEELCHALSVLDVHKKGCVDVDTFLSWWSKDDRFEKLRVSPEQLERLQHMSQYFNYFDFDKNGTLDLAEFTLLHKDLIRNGYHIMDVDTCIRELDTDGNGIISFNEFVAWMEKKEGEHRGCTSEAAIEEEEEDDHHHHDHQVSIVTPKCASRLIFDKFDTDSSGSISATELQNLCYQHGYCLSDEELAAALCKIDLDSSGTIEFEEFIKWWKSECRFETLQISEPELLALERLSEYFARFSPDRKLGEIDSEHFQMMHQDMISNGYSLPPHEECLKILDTDLSGTVSYNEFVRWMMNIGAITLRPQHLKK